MNLFEQLVQASKCVTPSNAQSNAQTPPKRPWTRANLLKGSTVNAAKAEERYKKFLTEWIKTSTLEDRMGYGKNTCGSTLAKLMARGLVERRPVEEVYSKKTGYEWRWVCQKNSGTV